MNEFTIIFANGKVVCGEIFYCTEAEFISNIISPLGDSIISYTFEVEEEDDPFERPEYCGEPNYPYE